MVSQTDQIRRNRKRKGGGGSATNVEDAEGHVGIGGLSKANKEKIEVGVSIGVALNIIFL